MMNPRFANVRLAVLAGAVLTLASASYAGTFKITTTSLPNSVDGVAVSYQLTSSGGTGTVTWKLASGSTLVTPLKLSTGGVVSGTPTASTNGAGSFKVVATDSAKPANTATATIAYIVNPENGNFRISSESFPNATVGTAYSTAIKSSGGVGTVTYKLIKSTSLPGGLTLALSGAITGTAMAASAGTNFWVQATDSTKPTAKTVTAFLGIVVEPSAISVTTTSLSGTVGVHLSTPLGATGGTGPYKWQMVGAASFDGLTLTAAGVLSGTPTTPSSALPSSKFQVKVSDSSSPALADFAYITVNVAPPPLVIKSTSPLPAATVNQPYSTTLAATGGVGADTWTVTGTALPSWLTLTAAGVLKGLPPSAGNVTFMAQVKDGAGKTASKSLTVPVGTPLSASNQTLPRGIAGVKYSQQLVASGGTTPYKWVVLSGQPPKVLTLSGAGVLSGTPAQASNVPSIFGVRVTDSAVPARTVTISVSITILNPVLVGPATLPPAYVGALYQAGVGATGGTPPYTFTQTGLPTGLSITKAGEINGTPASADTKGIASVTVTATDSSKPPISGSKKVSLPLYAAPAQCTPKDSSATTLAWLSGGYAYDLEQVYLSLDDAAAFTLGAFTADGKGNFTGGIYDTNGPLFSKVQNGTFTGTYAIGTDGRGIANISIPSSSGPSIERTFCLAIDSISGGVAGAAQMVEADATDVVSHGRMYAQGGTNFTESSVKGSWAFGLQGGKLMGGGYVLRSAVAGTITLDGAGNVSTGEIDSSGDDIDVATGTITNNYNGQIAVSGTYTLASTGRGTMAISNAGGSGGLIFYMAGANQVLVMTSEPGVSSPGVTNDVQIGRGLMRTTSTFNNATLSGTSVFAENGVSINGLSFGPETGAGLLSWDGKAKGIVTGTTDTNFAGAVTLDSPFNGIYAVDANGRVVLNSSGLNTEEAIYLVGPNAGFGVTNDTAVTTMEMENQTVPTGGFAANSLVGPFSEGSKWYSWVGQLALSGVVTVDDSTETISAAADVNLDGIIEVDQPDMLTFTPAANGRFAVDVEGKQNYILYLVSPLKGYAVDVSNNPWPTLIEINSH